MLEINKIYNEDCLVGMQKIQDESVDCIICDLPYNTTKNQWDSVIPLDALWMQYKRIIKKRGAIVLFAQTPFDKILGASNLSMLKYEWIWEKEQGTGHLNANFAPLKSHENILVFSKSASCFVKNPLDAMVYNPQKTKGKPYTCKSGRASSNYDVGSQKSVVTENSGDRYPKDILQFARDKNTWHPTQKPLDLIRYLVLTYSNEGDLVLDNCMGSATTAIACLKEKRNFLGFELNTEYWQKANERIEKEKSQPTLF